MQLPKGKALCACGKWTFCHTEGASSGPLRPLSAVPRVPKPRVLTEVWWAPLLGGGVVKGSVTLVGGEPGIGKSTLALDAVDRCIGETGLRGAYLAVEERDTEILSRAERIQCKHLDRLYVPNEKLTPELGILDELEGVCMVCLDSLSKLSRNDVMQVRILERLTEFAQKTNIPVFALSHVNKGKDFSGFMELQHEVDATVILRKDKKTRIRSWETIKNRNGSTEAAVQQFAQTDTGVKPIFRDDDEDGVEEEDTHSVPRGFHT